MNIIKTIGFVLVVAGVLGLLYGGFRYTKDVHETTVGPLVLSLKEEQTVNIPIWAGVGAIVLGTGCLMFSSRKKSIA